MSNIIMPEEFKAKLLEAGGSKQLCDEHGAILGVFIPTGVDLADLFAGPNISEEELLRREREDVYLTTDEVLSRLKALTDV